jgi:hypothetical protein
VERAVVPDGQPGGGVGQVDPGEARRRGRFAGFNLVQVEPMIEHAAG